MAKHEKKTTKLTNSQTVFVAQAPEASKVFVAGTFNGWATESTPMERQDDSTWRTAIELAPGMYEYKFLVDGVWCCNPNEKNMEPPVCCVPNLFGTMNYKIEIAENGSTSGAKVTAVSDVGR